MYADLQKQALEGQGETTWKEGEGDCLPWSRNWGGETQRRQEGRKKHVPGSYGQNGANHVGTEKKQTRVGGGVPRACYGEFAHCFTANPPAQTAPQDIPHREHQSGKWKSKPSSVPQQALRMPRKSWWFSQDWLELAGSQGIQQRHGQGRGPMACQPRPSFGPTPRSWVN